MTELLPFFVLVSQASFYCTARITAISFYNPWFYFFGTRITKSLSEHGNTIWPNKGNVQYYVVLSALTGSFS